MIQYSLICENDHKFDAWFKSASAYDEQNARGIISCPVCAASKIGKALMAPAVPRKESQRETQQESRQESQQEKPAKEIALSAGHPDQKKLRKAMRALREKVTSQADYVGDKFAEEARKIHDHEADPRGIYGEATAEEAASLLEDGVDFMPLPALPEEQN